MMKSNLDSENLIKALESLEVSPKRVLERRLIDTAIWFFRNKKLLSPENLVRRVEFLEKTVDIQLEILAMLTKRLQEAEGKPKSASLWLPRGVEAQGDFHTIG